MLNEEEEAEVPAEGDETLGEDEAELDALDEEGFVELEEDEPVEVKEEELPGVELQEDSEGLKMEVEPVDILLGETGVPPQAAKANVKRTSRGPRRFGELRYPIRKGILFYLNSLFVSAKKCPSQGKDIP